MSETTRVRVIVTTECQEKVMCTLSNGDISNTDP